MHGGKLWEQHPHVRTGDQLLFRERAADTLKKWFGTWTILFCIFGWIAIWITIQNVHPFDPFPYIFLNLCLSCLAAVQGVILQIAANRGDRINAEVAAGTYQNSKELLNINRQQLQILTALQQLRAEVHQHGAIPPEPDTGGMK